MIENPPVEVCNLSNFYYKESRIVCEKIFLTTKRCSVEVLLPSLSDYVKGEIKERGTEGGGKGVSDTFT